jgi:hypothetical protein
METVKSKRIEESAEAGSGAMFIPILGNLFPKLWGQKMNVSNKYLVFTDKHKYQVNEENYHKVIIGEAFDEKMDLFY